MALTLRQTSVISFWPCCEEQSAKAVVVDMTDLSYIDVSGLATLVEGLKVARNRQSTLCLKGLQGRVLQSVRSDGPVASVRNQRLQKCFSSLEGLLMANVLEAAGRRTISELDYVGSLNIQLWATLRAMGSALPLSGTATDGRRRCGRCCRLASTRSRWWP